MRYYHCWRRWNGPSNAQLRNQRLLYLGQKAIHVPLGMKRLVVRHVQI